MNKSISAPTIIATSNTPKANRPGIKHDSHPKSKPVTLLNSCNSLVSIIFYCLIFDFCISKHIRGVAQPFAVLHAAVALFGSYMTLLY